MSPKTLAMIQDLDENIVGSVVAHSERSVEVVFNEPWQPMWQAVAEKVNFFTMKGQEFMGEDGVARVVTSDMEREEFSHLAGTIALLSYGCLAMRLKK